MIKLIRGYYRLCLVGLVIGFGSTMIVLTSWIPLRIGRVSLSAWILTAAARLVFFVLNIQFDCPDWQRFRYHEGFLFPNHVSYLDIFTISYILPPRFLAKAEVKKMPVIGRAARALDCVFVRRDDKSSRAEARGRLARVERFPPVVIFPEGKRGPGDHLLPLRYGAFEILIDGGAPALPCVIVYDRLEEVIWHRGEPILKAIWRLASRSGPIKTALVPLDIIQPGPDDDPVALSERTHAAMTAVFTADHERAG